MIEVLVLGFFLSLDNFRSAIAIGTIPFKLGRAFQIALVFGFWDTVAPLVGGVIGQYIGEATGEVADYIGPALLGLYGAYILVKAIRNPEPPEEVDQPWVTLFGLPLALSLDNLLAGTGLGMLGFSPVVTSLIFGGMTVVMSLVGLFIGRYAARMIPIRADLVSGISLVTAAVVLPIAFSG